MLVLLSGEAGTTSVTEYVGTLRIEPRASRMLSGCDTTTPCAHGSACDHLLYKQNLESGHINIDLMKFADKYMVNDLYNFCSEHFMDHISEDDLIELINIGTLKDDDSLLDGCAGYIRKNHHRSFFKSEDWKSFKAENPECMLKIGNAM